MKKRMLVFSVLVILALMLVACGGSSSVTVRIGSKEFTEQYLLGNMYKLMLEDAGYSVRYQPMGGTGELHQALMSDNIDLYPEYTGTALLTVLEKEYDPSMTPDDVYSIVSSDYAENLNLIWGEQTAFNNTYCLTMTQEKSDELGIKTVSDLSQKSDDLVFGTVQEFTERPDGLPGLRALYGGFEFKDVIGVDPGLLYAGIERGDIDVTTCFGTDGQIAAFDLYVLEDDKGFWPPYPVGPIVRGDFLEENPDVLEILDRLAPLLDGDTMSRLNWEVAGNSREPDEVAKEFLMENGLLSSE
jgi:osmoprotectant transport system substrate-binding protein